MRPHPDRPSDNREVGRERSGTDTSPKHRSLGCRVCNRYRRCPDVEDTRIERCCPRRSRRNGLLGGVIPEVPRDGASIGDGTKIQLGIRIERGPVECEVRAGRSIEFGNTYGNTVTVNCDGQSQTIAVGSLSLNGSKKYLGSVQFRNSGDWKNFRLMKFAEQKTDPVTGAKLTSRANLHHFDENPEHYTEIGRASCRERVLRLV